MRGAADWRTGLELERPMADTTPPDAPPPKVIVVEPGDGDGLQAFPAEAGRGRFAGLSPAAAARAGLLFGSGVVVGAVTVLLLGGPAREAPPAPTAGAAASAPPAAPQPGTARSAPAASEVVAAASPTAGATTTASSPESARVDSPPTRGGRTARGGGPAAAAAASARQPPPAGRAAPGPPYRGSLEVRSTPAGAEVFLNGVRAGRTPIVLERLNVGSRAVRAQLNGYEPWSTVVTVVANQRVVATAVMRPVPAR